MVPRADDDEEEEDDEDEDEEEEGEEVGERALASTMLDNLERQPVVTQEDQERQEKRMAVIGSLCQAMLYVLCYRLKHLVAAGAESQQAVRELPLRRLLLHDCQPLDRCLPAVVQEFLEHAPRMSLLTEAEARHLIEQQAEALASTERSLLIGTTSLTVDGVDGLDGRLTADGLDRLDGRLTVDGLDGSSDHLQQQQQQRPVTEQADKMDTMMELTLAHLARRCQQGEVCACDQTMHCSREFAQNLVEQFQSGSSPNTTRLAAVSYLASFLARANFAPPNMITICLQQL
eukprot:gene32823-41820_t